MGHIYNLIVFKNSLTFCRILYGVLMCTAEKAQLQPIGLAADDRQRPHRSQLTPVLHRRTTTSMVDREVTSLRPVYEQGQSCGCCRQPQWGTSWDLRLSNAQWTPSLDELRIATKNGCQDCSLIFDALATYIAPKIELPGTKITIKPFPLEGRLHILIQPQQNSNDSHAELEVLRQSGTLVKRCALPSMWKCTACDN
jgi:hypothetical protein